VTAIGGEHHHEALGRRVLRWSSVAILLVVAGWLLLVDLVMGTALSYDASQANPVQWAWVIGLAIAAIAGPIGFVVAWRVARKRGRSPIEAARSASLLIICVLVPVVFLMAVFTVI
jgi:hypothetical protein